MLLGDPEDLIPLEESTALFPKRRGKHPNRSQPFRYADKGVAGVVLETWHSGICLCTTKAAVKRFIERLTEAKRRRPARPKTDGATEAAAAGERLKKTAFRHSRASEK